ncbi:hypothetical protein ACTFIZ_009340 [Dictyostelium cf. discoideum]
MVEYTFGKITSNYPFPKELKGIISSNEFEDIVNEFKSKVNRMPTLIYEVVKAVTLFYFIIRYLGLNHTQFTMVMGILSGINFSIIVFSMVFYISNKVKFCKLIYSLNRQYQYRPISFYSSSFLGFELKMTHNGNDMPNDSSSESSPLIGSIQHNLETLKIKK